MFEYLKNESGISDLEINEFLEKKFNKYKKDNKKRKRDDDDDDDSPKKKLKKI